MGRTSLCPRTRFIHELSGFGDSWFPAGHRGEINPRFLGRAVLESRYFDYDWEARKEAQP